MTSSENSNVILEADKIHAWFGSHEAVKGVSLSAVMGTVTALIGPSGCGKSTFIRTLNRLHEEIPHTRVEGQVILEGKNIYERGVDPVGVRRKIGMVFQKPNPFPSMSIFEEDCSPSFRSRDRI